MNREVVLNEESLAWLRERRIFFDLRGGERLEVGDSLRFIESTEIEPYVSFRAGYDVCTMGSFSVTNTVVTPRYLTVGRYCSLAPGITAHSWRHPVGHVSTSLFTHNDHSDVVRRMLDDHGIEQWRVYPNPQLPVAVIEHDVWIGANVQLNAGVTISTGAVVAAGSVVMKSVGPYEMVAGNPARMFAKRFDPALIELLLDSEWWNYKFIDFAGMPLDDPARFVEAFLKEKPNLSPWSPARARLIDMPHDRSTAR